MATKTKEALQVALDDCETRYQKLTDRFDNLEFRLSIIETMLLEIRLKLEEMTE